MLWHFLRLLLITAVLGLAAHASAARAEQGSAPHHVVSQCWAKGALTETLSDVAHQPQRWDCSGTPYDLEGERIFLRYDLKDSATQRYFATRRAALEAVHFLTIDKDGTEKLTSLPKSQWLNSSYDAHMRIPITDVTPDSRYVIVALDKASHDMLLDGAYLTSTEDADRTPTLLLLAALCGMLMMPLVFNAAFYRVLREDFVVWHSLLIIMLMLTVLLSSGLGNWLIPLNVMTLNAMYSVLFGLSVAAGTMFTYGFIEPGRMHPKLRRALPWCAVAAVSLSLLHTLFPYVGRPVQSTLYTASFAPILVIFLWAMVDALSRGSRAAIFQAVGWAPMMVVGLTRLVTGLMPSMESNEAMPLFYVGCVFEVICTAMGVADRFVSLKDQRDRARMEAEVLERLAERDALTGLLNRRAFDNRVMGLIAEGYNMLAVLDLDHFKSINDSYGHAVGDSALKATAEALRPNLRVEVFRMGGEEFVLLLRGKDGLLQAEKRRSAIPAVVADVVPMLRRRVTASMGVVDLYPGVDISAAFDRADKLLYQAKQQGRDRVVSGRIDHAAAAPPAADSYDDDGLGGLERAALEHLVVDRSAFSGTPTEVETADAAAQMDRLSKPVSEGA
jgi:diguanylate cyclase (GGDEF)-like protein